MRMQQVTLLEMVLGRKKSSLCQKNAEEVVTFVSSIDKIILAIEVNRNVWTFDVE